MLKFYADKSHLPEGAQRPPFSPIVWLHWSKHLTVAEIEKFWARSSVYAPTESLEDADVCFLPLLWNYYVNTNKLNLARAFVEKCKARRKPVYIWISGDYDYRMPFRDVTVILQGPQYTQPGVTRRAGIAEIPDCKEKYNPQPEYREWNSVPTVGFMGQAKSTKLTQFFVRNVFWHIAFQLRIKDWVPPPLIPHVILRKKVLNILQKDKSVRSNFVVREQFFTSQKDEDARVAYFQNIAYSDYVVCVRGGGNFSFRFFETLCMGRIPVIIDTGVTLPLDSLIDWKKYCVWVPESDIRNTAQYILDFHRNNCPDNKTFLALQKDIRSVWENHLRTENYYSSLKFGVCENNL